ncbi:MAG: hypothetical protein Q7J73_06385 [Dehalococcoidales bacterium]|nr:hypothetical protein [Dehalococcoidales bacterium]
MGIKGLPESHILASNKRLNKARETLQAQRSELEAHLKASNNAIINVPQLEVFIRDIQGKFANLDYDGKRLALDMLGITVWLNGQDVDITGIIEPDNKGGRCVSGEGCFRYSGL